MSAIRFFLILSPMTVLLLQGCGGSSDLPTLVPVTGTVTVDGKPMAGVTVRFYPMKDGESQPGRTPSGITDESGKFELTYSGNNRGAIPGQYFASVSFEDWQPEYPEGFDAESASAAERKKYETPPVQIAPQFSGSETSLEVEVKSGGNEPFKFDVESWSGPVAGKRHADEP